MPYTPFRPLLPGVWIKCLVCGSHHILWRAKGKFWFLNYTCCHKNNLQRERLCIMCSSMNSRANASLPILFQPVYSYSTANTVVSCASILGNMVTKGYYMWPSQILADASSERVGWACSTARVRGWVCVGSGTWEQENWSLGTFVFPDCCFLFKWGDSHVTLLLAKESPVSLTDHSCILYLVWKCICFPHPLPSI